MWEGGSRYDRPTLGLEALGFGAQLCKHAVNIVTALPGMIITDAAQVGQDFVFSVHHCFGGSSRTTHVGSTASAGS